MCRTIFLIDSSDALDFLTVRSFLILSIPDQYGLIILFQSSQLWWFPMSALDNPSELNTEKKRAPVEMRSSPSKAMTKQKASIAELRVKICWVEGKADS